MLLRRRNRYLTDPDFVPVPDMTGKDYADRLRRRITEMAAKSKTVPCEPGDTTYFAVVDEQGMVVSGIQSIFQPWGCGQVVPGTGIFLQNRGCYFSLQPQHVNVLQPGKRTAHTLCASLIMHHDEPFLVFGTMGGDGQAQTHLQVISNVLDGGMDIQEAISAPRWFHGRRDFGLGPEGLWLEGRFPSALVTALQARGHQVGVVEDYSEMMGHAQGHDQAARRDPLWGCRPARGWLRGGLLRHHCAPHSHKLHKMRVETMGRRLFACLIIQVVAPSIHLVRSHRVTHAHHGIHVHRGILVQVIPIIPVGPGGDTPVTRIIRVGQDILAMAQVVRKDMVRLAPVTLTVHHIPVILVVLVPAIPAIMYRRMRSYGVCSRLSGTGWRS